ncbi:MAG: CHAT domain-containing protein [Bacteroidia bacterium]|nr:CHAT domain-containing protein [Bacteroidia bacterium]
MSFRVFLAGLLILTISCLTENTQDDKELLNVSNSNIELASEYFNLFMWDSAYHHYAQFFSIDNNTKIDREEAFQNYIETCFELGRTHVIDSLLKSTNTDGSKGTANSSLIRHINHQARLALRDQDWSSSIEKINLAIKLNMGMDRLDSLEFIKSQYLKISHNISNEVITKIEDVAYLIEFFPINSSYGNALEVDLLSKLQWLYLAKGKYRESRYYLSKIDSILINFFPENAPRKARYFQDLGMNMVYSQKPYAALKAFKRSDEIYSTRKVSKAKEAEILNYSAYAWLSQNNFTRAKEAFQKSFRLYENLGFEKNKNKKLRILQNLANLPYGHTEIEEILGYYQEASEILKSSPNMAKLIPDFDFTIAMKFIKSAETDKGEQFLNKALDGYKYSKDFIENKPKQALLYQYFGDLFLLKNDFHRALKEYKKAKSLLASNGKKSLREKVLDERISSAFFNIESYDSAVNYIDKSLVDTEFLEFEKNYPSMSEYIQEKDIDIYSLLSLQMKAKILSRSYTFHKSYDLLEKSMKVSSLADQVIDSMKLVINQGRDRFTFLEGRKEIYGIGIWAGYEISNKKEIKKILNQSFLFSEKAKSNDLYLNLNELSKISTFLPNDEIENELHFLEAKILYFKSLLKFDDSRFSKTELNKNSIKDSLHYYHQRNDKIIENLNETHPAFARSKYNTKVISLGELQSTLSPSETLLEYFRTDTALYAFAINRDDVSFQKLNLPENFDVELNQFLLSSKTTPKSDKEFRSYYAQQAHDLYQVLVEPLLDSLKPITHEGKPQLIIVPDGKLGYLPWDALLTEYPQDIYDYRSYPFLMKKFSIRQAYSATLMKLLEDKETEDKALMAAFAPSYMSKSQLVQAFKSAGGETCELPDEDDFVDLAQSSQELDEILANINGTRFDTLNASEARFKEIANDYRILHLTMHGFTDDCDPMYSGLAFTPRSMLEAAGISDSTNPTNEGILHAYEIYNMRLNAELVVMSACQTGLGKIQAGEGIMSLARAFAHAGSPNTVMSLWQVQESATRRLMESFYQHLADGKGKDEALQLAKLDYLNEHADAHPFYWAGFTLIGDDKPIVEDNWFEKNWWMLAIGFFLLLVIYAVLRRYSSQKKVL